MTRACCFRWFWRLGSCHIQKVQRIFPKTPWLSIPRLLDPGTWHGWKSFEVHVASWIRLWDMGHAHFASDPPTEEKGPFCNVTILRLRQLGPISSYFSEVFHPHHRLKVKTAPLLAFLAFLTKVHALVKTNKIASKWYSTISCTATNQVPWAKNQQVASLELGQIFDWPQGETWIHNGMGPTSR